MEDVVIKLYKSVTYRESVITDFLYVENTVFGKELGRDYFNNKFENNIYGPSIIVIGYIGNEPVAADALWRNDINGLIAYQSSDTAVLDKCRGKGVFKKLVTAKLSAVEEDAIIYGFPNKNSFPGFLKMGWHHNSTYFTSLYTRYNAFRRINPTPIDSAYAKWWFKGRKHYYSLKTNGHYFLVVKRKAIVYSIIGEVDKETYDFFPKALFPCLLLTKSLNESFFFKGRIPMRIISKGDNQGVSIPIWKMDAI